METLRFLLAIWVARATSAICRRLGKGGSTLPGRIALKVDPRLVKRVTSRLKAGCVAVSGTNGKTTTSTMLAEILCAAGHRVAHNRSGANLMGGVATTLAANCGLFGGLRADVAVLEVDEATLPIFLKQASCGMVILTNFFRDQLDRYGELETIVRRIGEGIKDAVTPGERPFRLLLNADDPLVAQIGFRIGREKGAEDDGPARPGGTRPGHPRGFLQVSPPAACVGDGRVFFFGLEEPALLLRGPASAADVNACPLCEGELAYEGHYYAHLGRYRCLSCGFVRPTPEFQASSVTLGASLGGSRFRAALGESRAELSLRVPGLYNVYNALAAAAGASLLSVEPGVIVSTVSAFSSAFGRMERLEVEGRRVVLALVKNPAGFNEVLRAMDLEAARYVLFCLNDNYADGRDVSWIWDADFEALFADGGEVRSAGAESAGAETEESGALKEGERPAASTEAPLPRANGAGAWAGGRRFGFIGASGMRAFDMAVRLKYAGAAPWDISVEPDVVAAFEKAVRAVPPGGVLWVLPTYTCMLELRRHLSRKGHRLRW